MTGKKKAQDAPKLTKQKAKVDKAPKRPIGRPTDYNDQIAEEICASIAASERGLIYLCEQNPHWPCRAQIFVWLRRYPEFADQYARAKEYQVEVSVDYMQELMNEPHKYVDEETGYTRLDVAMVRAKMDAIKWQAGKLKPKKYGDAKIEDASNVLHEDVIKRKDELDERNKKEF